MRLEKSFATLGCVSGSSVHMNGRVYDYNLGRFLSVDPFIQEPGNSQSMNPYSYIMNNPLAGIDPSGYKAEEETATKTERVAVTGSRIKRKVTKSVTKSADGSVTGSVTSNGKTTNYTLGAKGWNKNASDIGSLASIAKTPARSGGNNNGNSNPTVYDVMGREAGSCSDDCEAVDSGSYKGEFPLGTDTTTKTTLGDGSTLVTQIIPYSCGEGNTCITRAREGDVQYLRTYKDGLGLPAVFNGKGKGIPWLDMAQMLIESDISRYYIEQSVTEVIKQFVDVRNTFYDPSGNFESSKLNSRIYRAIAKESRVLRSEYVGIVRKANRKQRFLSKREYFEERNND